MKLTTKKDTTKVILHRTFENQAITNVNWKDVQMGDVCFINCDLKNVNFQGVEFTECKFKLCSIELTNFDSASFEHTNITNCNLSSTRLNRTIFDRCNIIDCSIDNEVESKILKLQKKKKYKEMTSYYKDVRSASFISSRLQRSGVEGLSFIDTTFAQVDMSHTKYISCSFQDSTIYKSIMEETKFTQSDISGLDVKRTDTSEVILVAS